MSDNALVVFKNGGSLFPAVLADFMLTYLSTREEAIGGVPGVRDLKHSIWLDLVQQHPAPTYPGAMNPAGNMHLLDNHRQYLKTALTFGEAVLVEDDTFVTRMRHLEDCVTNWHAAKPGIYRLLEKEMVQGMRFMMPPQLHALAINYSKGVPDILARLLIENKKREWFSPMMMLRWVDVNPNQATAMTGMRYIVDREMD